MTALHHEVDAKAALIEESLTTACAPLACRRGCADCCVDELTVFPIEADLIRHHHAGLLAGGRPHPPGACAFLGQEGQCRIYAQRPYVCRTQGLPLRWQVPADQRTAAVEMRDICPLNEPLLGRPLSSLAPQDCWELGLHEGRLASLAAEAADAFAPDRVGLRDLFGA